MRRLHDTKVSSIYGCQFADTKGLAGRKDRGVNVAEAEIAVLDAELAGPAYLLVRLMMDLEHAFDQVVEEGLPCGRWQALAAPVLELDQHGRRDYEPSLIGGQERSACSVMLIGRVDVGQ